MYVPLRQYLGYDDPSTQNDLEGHMIGETVPAGQNWPGGQVKQSSIAVLLE